jgi:hypothetical protein
MTRRSQGVAVADIQSLIVDIRGVKVIPDWALARLYSVRTGALNQAVARNRGRFPEDFAFQLTEAEFDRLMSQFVTSNARGGRRKLPYVFTEHGAMMAANVLRSPRAVQMSVFVVRAFVTMRQMLTGQRGLARRLAELERKLAERLDVHETAIVEVLRQVLLLLNPPPEPEPPPRQIGFSVKESRSQYGTRLSRPA